MNFKMFLMALSLWTLMVAPACASAIEAGVLEVKTSLDEEIAPELRERILGVSDELIAGLRTGDLKKVEKTLSPKLMSSKGFTVESFVKQMSGAMNTDFTVLNHYHSTLSVTGTGSPRVTIVPSLTNKELLKIKGLIFTGNDAYNLFLQSTNKGWQGLLFLNLSKYEDRWLVNTFYFGTYSINGLTAPKIYELQKQAHENGRLTSCIIYSWALDKVLRPAPYLLYPDEGEYVDLAKLILSDFNKEIQFPFEVGGAQFIGLNVETTDAQGLIPVVYYITKKEFGPDVKVEVTQMKAGLVAKLYGIEKDFDHMLVRAFHEPPVDRKKKYENYGVVLDLK